MPNRADQSVKTRQRVGGKAIKRYVLAGGYIVAGIGALAVMMLGGQAGTLMASVVLTILIFLQISLLLRAPDMRASSETVDRGSRQGGASHIETGGEPILVLSVSDLGRVRSVWGKREYLKGVKEGAILEQILPPAAQTLSIEGGTSTLTVTRYPSTSGEWVVLVPASQSSALPGDEVLERTNFFAGLGHDLKSPLNAVIGFADIMDAEIRGPMPDAYKDYPSLIRESGETLLRLVEDILGYAKSEAGTYELDLAPMDIAASGESVMRQSQAMAEKAGVALKMQSDREVLALSDAGAVRRIWDNLVSNAIKYSASGDTVTLSAKLRDGFAVLQVSDTGAGMDADDLARIAKPFAQGRNAKGRAGTGLGLALVHSLAELHGGQVKIATALGQGTTVTVLLPAASEDQKRAAE